METIVSLVAGRIMSFWAVSILWFVAEKTTLLAPIIVLSLGAQTTKSLMGKVSSSAESTTLWMKSGEGLYLVLTIMKEQSMALSEVAIVIRSSMVEFIL